MTEIARKVIDIIKSHTKYETSITKDTLLVEDLGFTSIDLVELVYEIESEFDITMEFYDLEFEVINCVGKLIEETEKIKQIS